MGVGVGSGGRQRRRRRWCRGRGRRRRGDDDSQDDVRVVRPVGRSKDLAAGGRRAADKGRRSCRCRGLAGRRSSSTGRSSSTRTSGCCCPGRDRSRFRRQSTSGRGCPTLGRPPGCRQASRTTAVSVAAGRTATRASRARRRRGCRAPPPSATWRRAPPSTQAHRDRGDEQPLDDPAGRHDGGERIGLEIAQVVRVEPCQVAPLVGQSRESCESATGSRRSVPSTRA